MFARIKISVQLSLLVVFFAATLIAVASLGLYGQSSAVAGLNTVYEDRVVPLAQLESIVEQYAVDIVDTSHKVSDGALTWSQGRSNVRSALDEIESDWSAYLSTFLVPEEERLVAELKPVIATADGAVNQLQGILEREDMEALQTFIRDRLYPAIDPVSDGFQALMDVQLRVAETAYRDALANYQRNRTLMLGTLALVLLSGILLAWWIITGISRRLGAEPYQVAEIVRQVADQDLSAQISTKANDQDSVLAAMKRMIAELGGVIAAVRQSSEAIHVGARQIAAGNADLSTRTEQQASALEETASSMEQLTATVKHNADNARQASVLALDASSTAERGGQVVNQVVSTMHGISESSQQIAEITSMIDSIAFQTNILALNASVEAARAGEQGRGFAVVAGEVRNLASRSGDAAEQISKLIDGAVTQIEQGSRLAQDAGTTMGEVVEAVRRVTDIMDEISAASQEQSDGIEQVSQAVSQMDEVTQQNAALVQQASSAATSLEEQADRLEQLMARFRLGSGVRLQPAALPDRPAARPADAQRQSPKSDAPALPEALPAKAATKPRPTPVAPTTEDDWESF